MDFLLEIGCEEIPAGFIANAMATLQDFVKKALGNNNLSYTQIDTFTTPRRLAIRVCGLPQSQESKTIEKRGPSANIAFDADGNLTKAGQGFLRGAGANPGDVYRLETPKGDYIAIKQFIEGKKTTEILKQLVAESIDSFNFPKSMRWGSKSLLFARPVRWLVALGDTEVLDVETHGLKAGRVSYGIRWPKVSRLVEISSPATYEQALAGVNVVANREKRRELIKNQLQHLYEGTDKQVLPDRALLEIVTDLVEFPTAGIGQFDHTYLEMPSKIITSTLSQHQKYFSVQTAAGRLVNEFVFIANGNPTHLAAIRVGNEKVIRARLEDALFYWKEDTAQPLGAFVPKLADVTFQAKLGSLLEKTKRVEQLCAYICKQIDMNEEDTKHTLDAARLCKADLVTNMLGEKEFTKLQGYMGQKYALAAGMDAKVADAIYQHYMPRGQRDELPSTAIAATVAIADKMDTVCGICGVGLLPSGSADPFALRRAAAGIVQIINDRQLKLDLISLIEESYRLLADKLETPTVNLDFVKNYFKGRVGWLLEQNQIEYDVADSVMHINFADVADLLHRAKAVQQFKARPEFIRLVLGFKRVSNILQKASPQGQINPDLFDKQAEHDLFSGFTRLERQISKLLPQKQYVNVLEELEAFSQVIDRFFEDVLVNADDEQVKHNRLLLLSQVRALFLQVADIAVLVVE